MNLVLATHNQGKLKEFQALANQTTKLNWLNIELAPSDFNPEETGLTFFENALIKAKASANLTHKYALSDDSGICVDALDGKPGIYSARYSKGEAHNGCLKLLADLKDIPDNKRGAAYHCVMTLVSPAGELLCQAEGIWQGRLINEMRGHGGFGYDPIFFLDTHNKTVAELDLWEKNKLSHRAQAWQQIQQYLIENQQKF